MDKTFSKKDFYIAAGLVVIAFLIRIPYLSYPASPVFDEVYFSNFAARTLNGEEHIDVHPPFMRLVFAYTLKILSPGYEYREIKFGGDYGDFPYAGIRFISVVVGSLLAGVIYLLTRKIYPDIYLAATAGIAIVFDGALVTYSRLILYDIHILFLGFLGLLFLWIAIDSERGAKSFLFFVASAVLIGLAVSTKWTGLSFLASAIILLFLRKKIKLTLYLSVIAFITYFLVFLALYGLDNMHSFFNATLDMYHGHTTIKEHHPSQSPAYKWPFADDQFILWGNGKDDIVKTSPNLFSWSVVVVALFISAYFAVKKKSHIDIWLLGSYLANYVPFFFISRPMFLYHYFPALVFGFLMIPACLKILAEIFFEGDTKKPALYFAAGSALFFLIFIPFIY